MRLTFSLFGTQGPARSKRIDASERLNVYAEQNTDPLSGKPYLVWYSRPGLNEWTTLGASPVRGWRMFNGMLYVVAGSTLWRIGADRVTEPIGSLSGSDGWVSMADNDVDLLLVDSGQGYRYVPGESLFAPIAGFPGENSVAQLSGFFATDNSEGEVVASEYLSATEWGFGSQEQADVSAPKYVFSRGDILYVCTPDLIASWYVTGQLYPFGPTRGAVLNWRLASPASVAPYQEGLTALVTGNGEIHLGLLAGYDLRALSTQEVEREWSTYSTVADAVCAAVTADAHPLLFVTFPTAGKSWLYDASSETWARAESGTEGGRFIGQYAIVFSGKTLVSDYRTGRIYEVVLESHSDAGAVIPRELVSQPVVIEGERFVASGLELRMEVGETPLLSGHGSDPEVITQMADCGDWRPEREIPLGRQGERWRRMRQFRCGQFRELTVKVRFTEPVRFVLERASLEVEA